MSLTDREGKILSDIRDWEKKLHSYEPNDFQMTYEKYLEKTFALLPEHVQQQFFSVVDNWLFHLNAIIQGAQLQMDAKERILTSARVFNNKIEKIEDLKTLDADQLIYIAQQQIARHRLYSFAQGGLAGTGGTLMLGIDIPAMAVINLRAVQLIAMSYGIEVNTPHEMMTSLKVFHTSTLPQRLQWQAWTELVDELAENKERYFYEGNELLTDTTWLEQPIQQMLKAMVISLFRKKMIQGVPLVSMAVGAVSNYQLTRRVTEFTHRYYQLRFLLGKESFS